MNDIVYQELQACDAFETVVESRFWKHLGAELHLSPRETQVAKSVALGYQDKEIAAKLGLSIHTIRDYLRELFRKLDVSTRHLLAAKIFLLYIGKGYKDKP